MGLWDRGVSDDRVSSVGTHSIITRNVCFDVESDKEPDVRTESEQRDAPSDGITALDPTRLDTISPFAWDITPPYETNENSYSPPENNFNSRLCVLLWLRTPSAFYSSLAFSHSRFCRDTGVWGQHKKVMGVTQIQIKLTICYSKFSVHTSSHQEVAFFKCMNYWCSTPPSFVTSTGKFYGCQSSVVGTHSGSGKHKIIPCSDACRCALHIVFLYGLWS